jgi:hypothetical protein
MKTIKEITEKRNNNESVIVKGIYQLSDGSYNWMTYTRSGNCKTLVTAIKKIG